MRFRTVFENAPAGMTLTAPDGRLLEANRTFCEMLGYSMEEMLTVNFAALTPPDDMTAVNECIRCLLAGEQTAYRFTKRFLHKDGHTIWTDVNATLVRDDCGAPQYLIAHIQDIARHNSSDLGIKCLNHLYTMLSEVNQTIVHARSREELLPEICQVLTRFDRFKMAWVGWVDSETNAVIPVAQCGDENGFLRDIHIFTDDRREGRGPTGTCIRENRTCVYSDFADDPRTLPWREAAARAGFGAAIALPVRLRGKACGALMVYKAEKGFFSEQEIHLLEEAAAGISFAIDHIETGAERQKADETLRRNERKYRELVQNANSVILRWTPDGKITFLNEYGQDFFGYTEAEILGRHVVGTIVPETESSNRDLAALMVEIAANPARFEHNINENILRNGERIWIDWTNKVVPDDRGRIKEILSIGSDITERRQAEAEVQRMHRLLNETQSEMKIGGWEYDAVTHRMMWTHQVYQIYGVDPSNYDPSDIVHNISYYAPEDRARIAEAFHRAVETGESYDLELRFINAAGQPLWVRTMGKSERTDERVTRIFGNLMDITERKCAEEEVRQLNERLELHAAELEQRVAERTAELTEAKERAELADRLKSTFLATMSHELRTPLNSIIGFTGILVQELCGPLNGEQAKQLRMVQKSARHLLNLINDVLDLSKIEAGQISVACEPFDLRKIVSGAIAVLTPLAEKNGVNVHASIFPDISRIVGDSRRTEQIFMNLLNNAIKFTPQGGDVHVNVERVHGGEVGTREKEREWVRLSVRDTGIGIKPEDMRILFKPFQQIDTSTTRQFEGTGLGLSISKRLVELLGGEIRAESGGPGKGSQFTFTLPATQFGATTDRET